jgi:hypothetical protein
MNQAPTKSNSKPPISFPFYLDVSFAHHLFTKGSVNNMTWTTVAAIKFAFIFRITVDFTFIFYLNVMSYISTQTFGTTSSYTEQGLK